MFNFSDSYFDTQSNLESPNRFEPLVKMANKYPNPPCSYKPTSINGLKFASINIDSIGEEKKLELVAFLDFYKHDIVAIQETKLTKQFPQWNSSRNHVHIKSVWVEVFANRTSHYIASWYREPSGSHEDFQFFRNQLEYIKSQSRGSKLQ